MKRFDLVCSLDVQALLAAGRERCAKLYYQMSRDTFQNHQYLTGEILMKKEKEPVVVATDADADEMNRLHGESYGVDWVYDDEDGPPDRITSALFMPTDDSALKAALTKAFNDGYEKGVAGYHEGLKLALAAERERCAKLCDDERDAVLGDAIRALGNQPCTG